MSNYSNRDIERLYDRYNPNQIKSGDLVIVNLHELKFAARVVGLDLDLKNKKVFANLKLMDQGKKYPIRVDVSDCKKPTQPLYPGHHNNN